MAKIDRVPIRNFSRVSGTVFRGGAANQEGVAFIQSLGIKTIIDLRQPSANTRKECLDATQYALNYFNIPLGYTKIPDPVIAAFLAVSLHPNYQPVFIHDTDGIDRTGALVGIYRIAVEGWPFAWVYSEMLSHNFRPWQLFLKQAVKRFADRMTPLNFQQRLWALQELVESNIFTV